MPNYRRFHIQGATVFITLVTYQRALFLTDPDARRCLREAWQLVLSWRTFTTDAICLLPDHLHVLISLPDNDSDYSTRIREIKRIFTRKYQLSHPAFASRNPSHQEKHEATLWQRRFWEHTIRDEVDYQNHFDYIHYNPVKHGLVDSPCTWQWSSFHRYLAEDIYDVDWGSHPDRNKFTGDFGE